MIIMYDKVPSKSTRELDSLLSVSREILFWRSFRNKRPIVLQTVVLLS